MKKRDLATLAMIGVSAGLVVAGCQQTGKNNKNPRNSYQSRTSERMSPDMERFYSSLSPEGKQQFDQLDAQHKMMAMEMANQKCSGKNACKGMGGCATRANSCAGENSCKGRGGPPVKDPNKAVDIQHEHQMQERGRMNNGMRNGNNMHNNGNGMHNNNNSHYNNGNSMHNNNNSHYNNGNGMHEAVLQNF